MSEVVPVGSGDFPLPPVLSGDVRCRQPPKDVLYQSISDGRRYAGMEHWLPLFHERLETLFDYIGDTPLVLDANAADAVRERLDQVSEHYTARQDARGDGGEFRTVPYMPVEPGKLYFSESEWTAHGRRQGKRHA